jgi:hypothetical protein
MVPVPYCYDIYVDIFVAAGVSVSELSFPDGSAPTQEILDKWLSLVNKEFVGEYVNQGLPIKIRTSTRFSI